jgi:DNA-binding CsgD family transcriptional regulator
VIREFIDKNSKNNVNILANGLAAAIETIGTPNFAASLLVAVNDCAPVRHLSIVTFSPRRLPSSLLASSRHQGAIARQRGDDYVSVFYKEEPSYEVLAREIPKDRILLIRRQADDFSESYYQRFFIDQEITDTLTFVSTAGGRIVMTNVYKGVEDGMFCDPEIEAICLASNLISSLTMRHCQLISLPSIELSVVVAKVCSNRRVRLTGREADVCEGILRGQTSEAIGISLGIAASSVITYRKSLYRKLDIVSQSQLFALALNSLSRDPQEAIAVC